MMEQEATVGKAEERKHNLQDLHRISVAGFVVRLSCHAQNMHSCAKLPKDPQASYLTLAESCCHSVLYGCHETCVLLTHIRTVRLSWHTRRSNCITS